MARLKPSIILKTVLAVVLFAAVFCFPGAVEAGTTSVSVVAPNSVARGKPLL
jgi:hypothetical protein